MRANRTGSLTAVCIITLLNACGDPGPHASMNFDARAESREFWSAPYPSADLQAPSGHFDLSAFPHRGLNPALYTIFELVEQDMDGASLTGAIYFPLSAPVNRANLPDIAASTRRDSKAFLMAVDPGSPTYLQRHPLEVEFRDGTRLDLNIAIDAGGVDVSTPLDLNYVGRYAPQRVLSLLPVQGRPLEPNTTYAAVLLRSIGSENGGPLEQPSELQDLLAQNWPSTFTPFAAAAYSRALDALTADAINPGGIAAVAAFVTGDPAAPLQHVYTDALSRFAPNSQYTHDSAADMPGYCVFRHTIAMPSYQDGATPYRVAGGRWLFDDDGVPIFQEYLQSRVTLSVPRAAMPAGGYPVVVFVRAGGGPDAAMLDRGVSPDASPYNTTPGTGPAQEIAAAGYAGITFDGPVGGPLRGSGVTPDEVAAEQTLFFNFINHAALRDNARQSAVETALVGAMVGDLNLDASGCDAKGTVSFDASQVWVMGHSTGATIAQIALGVPGVFRGAILSGAGSSYLENVMHKQKPAPVTALASAAMLQPIYKHEPALNLLQWAAEPADPPPYLVDVLRPASGTPVQVLMLQGIIDHYILPPMANATTLAFAMDLVGEARDEVNPDLNGYTPLRARLPIVGRSQQSYPVSGNISLSTTAAVVQVNEDGLQDGHEVIFQLEGPKHQYRCFLHSARSGAARVVAPDSGSCD